MALKKANKPIRRRTQSGGMLNMVLLCVTAIACALLLNQRSDVQVADSQIKPTIVAEFDTVSVPVPTQYVPTGTKLRTVQFQQIAYPRHQLPAGALVSLEGYLDSTTMAPLPANLPIFPENITKDGVGSNPVVESIPAGMRAITIQVDATSSVEGWAGSGSIVDVLLIENKKTSVIAEKVRIISAERSLTPVSADSSPSVPNTVTLLVTQEQCLAINTAVPLGRIAFALRGTSDGDRWIDPTYSSEELKGKGKIIRKGQGDINGYVSVKDNGVERKFALSEGKWIPTENAPEGFFAAEEKDAQARFKAD
jgi:Flp pilus assembly protein CpaB